MPSQTKLTYEDYLLLPEDGLRHEIVDGEHVVNSAPVPRHQYVSAHLYLELHRAVEAPGLGEVYYSPLDVELSPHDIVQPDLVVLRRENLAILKATRVVGTPDLLVEILSPGTRQLDRVRKRARYEAAGVPQYWIVDPDENTLENWVLRGDRLELLATERERVSLGTMDTEVVQLAKIWWHDRR